MKHSARNSNNFSWMKRAAGNPEVVLRELINIEQRSPKIGCFILIRQLEGADAGFVAGPAVAGFVSESRLTRPRVERRDKCAAPNSGFLNVSVPHVPRTFDRSWQVLAASAAQKSELERRQIDAFECA